MSGQSATMPLAKAKSMAKGAGCEYPSLGGSKATAPTEGKELGKSMGKSASSGDMKGKSKQKHMY
jgi:hypothetical protein